MVRGPLLLAGLLAAFLLIACARKEQAGGTLSNAEIEGQWRYDTRCAGCHENPQPDLHKQPPNLHGLFIRTSLPSGAPVSDEQIRKTIIEGRGTMPAFDRYLRKEDVRDLVKYLHTLK
ncbi:MAG: c-type cytochrome [Terriglobales bacterium]